MFGLKDRLLALWDAERGSSVHGPSGTTPTASHTRTDPAG